MQVVSSNVVRSGRSHEPIHQNSFQLTISSDCLPSTALRASTALRVVADVDSKAAQFHLWRRRVKDHWYHLRLLANRDPKARLRVPRVEKLEDWLGNEHNLAILRTTIVAAPDRFGDARTTAVVLGCITRYQTWLRQQALRRGHRVFAETPKTFAESITIS